MRSKKVYTVFGKQDNVVSKVVINVIHHTDELTFIENVNLERLVEINNDKYDIVFILPEIFRSSDLINQFSSINFCFVEDSNLSSSAKYNRYLISHQYYDLFNDYEFVLVYQLDTWIFSLDLEPFVDLGFDIIGAPIFSEDRHLGTRLINGCNGGVSLRKVKSFQEILRRPFIFRLNELYAELGFGDISKHPFRTFFKRVVSGLIFFYKPGVFWPKHINEDLYWSVVVPRKNIQFRVAPMQYCIKFCFDQFPRTLYVKNNNELPLFVHALEKYDFEFWEDFLIFTRGYDQKVSD